MAFRRGSNDKPTKNSSLNVSNERLFESIRKRAYELYCKRGYKNGHDISDWVEAEKQVKKELGLSR